MIRFHFARSCARMRLAPAHRLILTGAATVPLLALAACGTKQAPDSGNDSTPQQVEGSAVSSAAGLLGTPMAERVAVIGLLNKRNGITRKLSMKPGQAFRVDNAIVRLRACETTAPWENVPETGAFVQLDVRETRDNQWRRAFSGWLFKDRPDRNVVQHPIYDVWVMSCAMTWPETGDETVRVVGSASSAGTSDAGNASESSAPQSPPTASSPAPSAASNSAE
jgi:hypothetical protein